MVENIDDYKLEFPLIIKPKDGNSSIDVCMVISMVVINEITEVMNHIEGLKAIIFLDEPLYDEKDYVKSGYREIAKHLPYIKDVEAKLWKFFENGKNAIDELLMSEGCFSEVLKNECLNIYRNHTPDIHLSNYVISMLMNLRSEVIKLGLITDGRPDDQRTKIILPNLKNYFDKIIITDELGGITFRKPNGKIYDIFQEHFRFTYEEIAYAGDNLNKDFLYPKKVNMVSIYFLNNNGVYQNGRNK